MSIYGEYDDRFHTRGGLPFRPRPTLARLFVVSLCHLLLAAWLVTSLLSFVDMLVLRVSGERESWIVYATPWSTVKTELAANAKTPTAGAALAASDVLRADDDFARSAVAIAVAFLILAFVVLLLWPGRLTLASRLFATTFATMLAAFGAASAFRPCLALSRCDEPPFDARLAAALIGAAAIVIVLAEVRAVQQLSYVLSLDGIGRRLLAWLVRIEASCVVLAAATWLAGFRAATMSVAVVNVLTFVTSLLWRPRRRYEKVDAPELREAAVVLPIVMLLLLGATGWLFGFAPLRAPRALVLRTDGVRVVAWSLLPQKLRWDAPVPPAKKTHEKNRKIDAHWTTEEERARRRHDRR